ncbi:MAG TPA: J domain-containing protein [Vicinamibacterales bacterium]|nr:J domain-containing protein [Vicinamibacterales bacterium]
MDFYIVLGIDRDAGTGDIKRAYKRLARRLHPDINPGDRDAAARFRQVLDAYETLIDPDRRRRYDAGQLTAANGGDTESFGFAGFDFSSRVHAERTTTFGDLFEEVLSKRTARPGEAATHGADIHARAHLSFEEAWRGAQRTVTVNRHDACRSCSGSGYQRVAETRCVACEGSGLVRSVRGHMVFAKNCPTCGGEGRLKQEMCAFCGGQGVGPRSESLTVRIPPAVADGSRVRIPGKGHAGVRGGSPGDLLIDVSVAQHPIYRREGDELHMTVPIAVHEAALGAKFDIETPDGPVRLRVPPGTQSGQRFRFRDRGAPTRGGRRGDLVVEVRMKLPKVLDERSRELLREFGRINGESVREPAAAKATVDKP